MTLLGVILIAIVGLSVYGCISDAIHNPKSGGAYDELKKFMGW